jgi:unsaturated rhamnogalacturonyl hydrolase
MLDCYYNSEWRADPAGGNPVRYHYVWQDTTDSGFSQLAAIIVKLGGKIDSLCQAPTPSTLLRADLYLLVDPDTPLESKDPKTLEAGALDALTEWVGAGGILILLGNDRGNANLELLTLLGDRFGIRFNEDSRNKITGRHYESGTFENLPDHPLFKGVRRIFLKEICTLQIKPPAVAVLSEGGDVIMAFARFGNGAVFAVGDPWFYNEYMDERKLPQGYDNAIAADNLFRWLLQSTPSMKRE